MSHRHETEVEVTSRDLTRNQLLAYIFSDFVRIWYYVLALAIDGLFIPLIFQYRPTRLFHIASMTGGGGIMELYLVYMISVVCILEAGAVWLEAIQYRKRWPREGSKSGTT